MSSDGVSWTTVGSTPFASGFEGFVVTSHDTTTIAQATFEELAAGPEWPWYQTDIGDVGLAGNAEVVHQETLVSGSGDDIWGMADAFHYLYSIAPFTNRIVARVVSEQNTDTFAKAGLVMGDLTASGRRVILDVKPDGNLEFMARTSSGTPRAFIAGANAAFRVAGTAERRRLRGRDVDGRIDVDDRRLGHDHGPDARPTRPGCDEPQSGSAQHGAIRQHRPREHGNHGAQPARQRRIRRFHSTERRAGLGLRYHSRHARRLGDGQRAWRSAERRVSDNLAGLRYLSGSDLVAGGHEF